MRTKKLLILLMFGVFVFLIFPQDIFAEYVPIGKYIWFNLSPASNSTLGRGFEFSLSSK